MQKVSEYEQNAAECREKAAKMTDPHLKKQLEDMAGVWDRLASERRQGVVEKGPDKAQPEVERAEGLFSKSGLQYPATNPILAQFMKISTSSRRRANRRSTGSK